MRLLLVASICTGCAPAAKQGIAEQQEADRQEAITLTPVDREDFDRLLSELRGSVVLVDVWATWCGPCVEQLPHSVELANRLGPKGLTVVALSFDAPDSAAQVIELLQSLGAQQLTHLISKHGLSTESIESFDVPDGALPHYKLYDREGMLRYTFGLDPQASEPFSIADIEQAVSLLLGE